MARGSAVELEEVVSVYSSQFVEPVYDLTTASGNFFANGILIHNCPWFPIDHDPIPQQIADRARTADYPLVYSKFGLKQAESVGIKARYIPHGVDTEIYAPVSETQKREIRKRVGLPEDCFLVDMVAANKGYPSRKSIPECLLAFREFQRRHADAVLYLHMDATPAVGGVDVKAIRESLGIPKANIFMVDQFRLAMGISDRELADIYRASDVHLSPSRNEGFGIPILEAQACGIPVITTDFTSMPELTWAGIAIKPDQPEWTQLNSWVAHVPVGGIIEALETIYKWDSSHRQAMCHYARERAMEYDWDKVALGYWKPFLEEVEEAQYRKPRSGRGPALESGRGLPRAIEETQPAIPQPDPLRALARSEDEYRQALAESGERKIEHVHEWASTALYQNGLILTPCRDPECSAYRERRDNTERIVPDGMGLIVGDIPIAVENDPHDGIAKLICQELAGAQDMESIPFEPGDVILDIGAHVGIVSIYLAKRFPGLRIIAVEPAPENFARLQCNLIANGVTNVLALNVALGGRDGLIDLHGNPQDNSGGISAYAPQAPFIATMPAITLARLWQEQGLGKVRLLKIDCEGAEYEILHAAGELLRNVEYLRGEFHQSDALRAQGFDPEKLFQECIRFIDPDKIKLQLS